MVKIIMYIFTIGLIFQNNCKAESIKIDTSFLSADSVYVLAKANSDFLNNNLKYYLNLNDDELNSFQKWKIRLTLGVELICIESISTQSEKNIELYNKAIIAKKFINKKDWEEKLEYKVYLYLLRRALLDDKEIYEDMSFFEKVNWRVFNMHKYNYKNYNLNN